LRPVQVVLAHLDRVIIHADVAGGSGGDWAVARRGLGGSAAGTLGRGGNAGARRQDRPTGPALRWAVSTVRGCMVSSFGPVVPVRRGSLLVILRRSPAE
jgi:hypothetical protein